MNMTLKSRIEEISSEIKSLDDQSAELQSKSFELRQERELLIAQMILEDKMLNGTKWTLTLNGSDGVVLNYAERDHKSIEFIVELARRDYHSWFELTNGVSLRFDDNDISLAFKESKQAMPFIRKHGLAVDASGVTDRLAKLKRDVAALESIYHQFSSIV